jgi:AcrR family transcriptional regulator
MPGRAALGGRSSPTSTRERILSEATRQLLDKGYPAFTIAAVREATGLSSGSMFHAFPSKPALAAAVYVEGMRDYQNASTTALDSSDDPLTSLHALLAAHLSWVEQNRTLARFLFTTQPDEVSEAAKHALMQANQDYFAAIRLRYDELEVDFFVAHVIWMGATQEYCRQWVRGMVDVPPTELTETLHRAALAALNSVRQVSRSERDGPG